MFSIQGSKLPNNFFLPLLCAVAVGYWILMLFLLWLRLPPVWPDEVLFADPALDFMRYGTLGTKTLTGFLPHIAERTYWMPPGYFIFLSLVFRLTSASVELMRGVSCGYAWAVLLLTYRLSRRGGLPASLACLPVSFLALNFFFLQGASIGRMDMMALTFFLLSLDWITLPCPNSLTYFGAGVAASLAAMTHPMVFFTPLLVITMVLLQPSSHKRRWLTCLISGLAFTALPWLIFILKDPASFIAQFGAQLARKSNRPATLWFTNRFFREWQGIGIDGATMVLWGIAGIGFWTEPNRERRCLWLFVSYLLLLALMMWSHEMWYALYPLPLMSIGLVLTWTSLQRLQNVPQRILLRILLAVLISYVAFNNIHRALDLYQTQVRQRKSVTDYHSWCAPIAELLTPGSLVMVSAIPDPSFCLMRRADLRLRQFMPDGVPLNQEAYEGTIRSADFIIVGRWSPSEKISSYAFQHGTIIGTFGVENSEGYFAKVYQMNK